MAVPNAEAIRDALRCGRSGCTCNGSKGNVHCPAHPDDSPSLSVKEVDGKALVHCHSGCSQDAVIDALKQRGLWATIHSNGRGEGYPTPPDTAATVQPLGCTLAQYAEAKLLPIDFLRGLGLQDMSYLGNPAVRIPYMDADGSEGPIRFRLALSKGDGADNRFKWKSGSKPILYGLWRLQAAREAGYLLHMEGESDCHTAWLHDIPALGIPGANNWREERDAPHLEGVGTIYVVMEPDKGGEAVLKWLSASVIRHRVKLVSLAPHKDISALYLADPANFKANLQAALAKATPWTEYAESQADAEHREAWQLAAPLAKAPRILDAFANDIELAGVVGERKATSLLYLCLVSRLFEHPVSAAVKGPSAGGKSYVVDKVLGFFPADTVYVLSAMSERALAYSEEPLSHKFLVLYEAVGLKGDFASYLLRSLLSEGRIRYETVEKTADGLKPRLIEREGPTGLIVTTTAIKLHPENETRIFSIPVTDTKEQTVNIMRVLASEDREAVDTERWIALQRWLAGGERRVTIPYAKALVDLTPPIATRLRRDFGAILALIRAHAVLHQASRERDSIGRIIATLDDYEVVRELVADLVGDSIGATVTKEQKETIEALKDVIQSGKDNANVTDIAALLKLDKSTALRRVNVVIEKGFIKNLEDHKGREARLVLDDPLPDRVDVLPDVERLQGCVVAVATVGIGHPPSPPNGIEV